jgi:hypothetical protein
VGDAVHAAPLSPLTADAHQGAFDDIDIVGQHSLARVTRGHRRQNRGGLVA